MDSDEEEDNKKEDFEKLTEEDVEGMRSWVSKQSLFIQHQVFALYQIMKYILFYPCLAA